MVLEALAENIYVILSAYLLAFLPWTVLDSSDFIGPEWKSIAATRREGRIHLIVVMLPITYIIFYITVQAATRDFKEMFASFVALLFSILHLSRTIWGLLQVNELHTWVSQSIQNLQRMGVYYKPQGGIDVQKQHPRQLADQLLINETLVDNQITHGDTKTYLKYGSLSLRVSKSPRNFLGQRALFVFRLGIIAFNLLRDYVSCRYRTGIRVRRLRLVPHDPIEVWLRWSSALIAQGFGHWVQAFDAAPQPNAAVPSGTPNVHRHFMQRRDYFAGELLSSAGLHVCAEYALGDHPLKPLDETAAPHKRSSSLFLWEEWDSHSEVRDGRVNKNDLFLSAVISGIGLPFSCPHFRTLDKNPNSKTVADNGYTPHALSLDRIVESLPVEFGEDVSQLDPFKLEWFAILLSLGARAESHSQEFPKQRIPETFDDILKTTDPALENLRDQLGFSNHDEDDSQGPRDSIQVFRLCSFPIADRCLTLRSDTNRLVMKVGELIDVWMSLTAGDQFQFLLSVDDSWEQLCLNNSKMVIGHADKVEKGIKASSHYEGQNIVSNQSLFHVQKNVERARLMIQFAKTGHKYDHLDQTITFMGYSMECVRSCLARWLHSHPESFPDAWEPRIEYAERNPLISNTVVDVTGILKDFIAEVTVGKGEAYFLRKGVQNRLIWKIQTEFQKIIMEFQKEKAMNRSSPSSEIMMMLCILSFPSLQVHVSEEIKKPPKTPLSPLRGRKQKNPIFNHLNIDIRPSCAPQKLFVRLHCETREDYFGAFAALGREDNRTDEHFLWESWRDSFTARLQAMTEWQNEHNLLHTEVMNSPPNISRKTGFMSTGAIGTGEKIRTWLGWLPFRFEFCRYEVEHPEFLKQYPRRTSFQVAFTNRLHHEESTARFPGFNMHSFRYEQCDPEYLMYACSVIRDYLGPEGQRPMETLEHLSQEVERMMDKPSEYFAAGTRKLHRAVILLEIAAIELGNPSALRASIKHLTEHYHIAADIERAVELLERCVAKFYIVNREADSSVGKVGFDIKKRHIESMYSYLMSKHGYEAQVFWSYFKFLELMSSGNLNSSSLQSTMRRTFMHTKDYDIVFELGQFPTASMTMAPGAVSRSLGSKERQSMRNIEFAFYERAIAEGRSARSMFELGRMYEKGERGLHIDDARAAALYHMAIEYGHSSGAKKALGDLYRRGAPRLMEREGDLDYAVKMYWRAVSEDNDGEAMYELGNLYHFDNRLANDPIRAAALYQGAIRQSNEVRAMRRLANMYRDGDGVSKDPVLSVILYQLAIDIGDDNDSRAQLAVLLRNGDEGVDPDEQRAQNLRQHLQHQGMMVPRT